MSASNAEVVKRFFSGATKLVGNSLYIGGYKGNYLYHRYGVRTLIAKRLAPDFFLINGDNTASGWGGGGYNTQLSRLSPKSPVISFSALEQCVQIEDLKPEHFLEVRLGFYGTLYSEDNGQTWFDYRDTQHWPRPGQFTSEKTLESRWNKSAPQEPIPCLNVDAHILGGVLFTYGGQYFLSAMDEGSYFISQLPGPCQTIDEAFLLLKPNQVQLAEALGNEVRRQGEWFFVKIADDLAEKATGLQPKQLLRAMRKHSLPVRDPRSNFHVCSKLYRCQGNVIVSGKVLHYSGPRGWRQPSGVVPTQAVAAVGEQPVSATSRHAGFYRKDGHWYEAMSQEHLDWPITHKTALTREHATVNLPGFWLAVRNTELASYTSTVKGGVD